jgi:hypothetical protein
MMAPPRNCLSHATILPYSAMYRSLRSAWNKYARTRVHGIVMGAIKVKGGWTYRCRALDKQVGR